MVEFTTPISTIIGSQLTQPPTLTKSHHLGQTHPPLTHTQNQHHLHTNTTHKPTMAFTPPSNPPVPIQASPISSIPSSRKLPIKRKTPDSALTLTTPKQEPTADDDGDADHDATARHPPFKFHRIWSEPDEIRLLQGLIDCSSRGFSFPRDLGLFYAQFCNGMSQPFSKSQLSEKLRRLRKKFRMISSRIAKGLDKSLLPPQDRALYDLSKRLWDPDRPSVSFGGTNSNCKPTDNDDDDDDNKCKSNLAGVKVSFSPKLPSSSTAVLALPSVVKKPYSHDNGNKVNKRDDSGGGFKYDFSGNGAGDVKVNRDVNVELERNAKVKNVGGDLSGGIVHFASTTLADVLDQSLKEVRKMIDLQRCSNMEKVISFEKRWRDQHIAEFDVLAKRLKLILEHSSMNMLPVNSHELSISCRRLDLVNHCLCRAYGFQKVMPENHL